MLSVNILCCVKDQNQSWTFFLLSFHHHSTLASTTILPSLYMRITYHLLLLIASFLTPHWYTVSIHVVTLPTFMDTPTTQCKRKTEAYLTHYIYNYIYCSFHTLPVCMLNHADSLHTPSLSMLRLNTCIIITIFMILMFLLKLKN